MPNPRGLALLSTHLEKLLGREYRSLAARYHGLLNEEGMPALEKDAHRAHVAVLRGWVRREDTPSLILETLNPVLTDCLPVYHVQYEKDRETSIRLALEKIKASILKVRGSHWSRRDLALEVLEQIQQGYERALAYDVANIQTRVGVAILEQGYYSLDVKTARRLLCIDARGGEFRENRSGAHAVCAANGIHYKPSPKAAIGAVGKDISEIEPAWEYLAVSLMQSIADNQLAASPTGLWSIQDVPLERADALKSTSGIVQAGLSIQESMCFREFLFLREAIRFFKRTMGEEALIHLLEDQQQGYSHFLALAKEHFPQTFIYPEVSTEEEHAARSRVFQESFQSLTQGKAIEDCFEEMQNRINRFDVSEAGRVIIFRELYEKHKANLGFLQVLLVLTRQYPALMDGQSITTSLRLLKSLPSLWTLFPKETTRDAIARIEWVLSDYLDKEAASTLWVGLLFTLPKDAKSDNFRLQLFFDANKRLERCRIVSIDNDLSFSMPFVPVRGVDNSKSETPELGLTIKNILYFLPELLEQSIDPEACARLLSQSAQSQWLAWLCLAARRNEEHAAWAAQGILSAEEATRLQIRLPKQTLEFILGQWERLQVLLKANPKMSHGALLEALYPAVAATYHETVVREVNAHKKYPTVIDYERLVHDECCDRGCYKIAFHPEDTTPDKEAEICLYYHSAKSQAAPTFEPLPETEVELSEFVLTLLRRQNWSQLDKAEHWPLVEAFSLLSRAERQDWEENVPSEERQGLWQFWLKEAIRRGAPFVAARLLDLGASAALPMGEDFKMPLHYFCEVYLHYANLDEAQTMVDILLSHHSAQPNAYDTKGYTPLLQWANVRRQELLSAEHTATAEKVLGALCLQGADINLTDGHTSGSVLDKMVKRNNPQGFILAVAYGAKECRDMAAALEWCHTHLEVQGMQSALRRLRQQSLTWAWWLGLPEWQHKEGGRPVQGVVSGVFSLPQPLWRVWEQAALDLPEAPIESVIARKEKYGRRKVRAIEYGETRVHLKPRPEMPAMEFAVAALLNTLFGDLVAPSDCLGVMDDRKKMHSVLLSQTVAGEPLIDALDSPEKEASFEARLDKRQTSAQIIGAMLIHPEDGSPANYLVSPKFAGNGEEANLIVAVDTDHAFVEAMGEDGSLQVKSILFCLKAMMAPVHPVWRDRIVGLAVKPFLSNWFKEVEYYQNQSHHIFNQRARIALQDVGFGNRMASFLGSKKAALPVVMTFPLHEAAIIAVHDRFMQLQSILREKPTITHLALLKHLNPALGKRYQEAFEKNPAPNQIMKRFYDLCGKSYGKKGQTLSTTEAVLKAMRLPEAQEKAIIKQDEEELFTPAKALKTLTRISIEYENKRVILKELYERGYSEIFIHLESKALQMQIVSELDWRHRQFINANKGKGDKKEKEKEAQDEYWNIEKQERVLSCFIQAKISFRRLAIAHCAAFTERHLEALLACSRDIAYIKLIDCPNLGNGVFEVLRQYNNTLIALTLVQCHNLTETAWGLFEPTFKDLESVRIEDNLALVRISLKAPKLRRCHLDKNPALSGLIINRDNLLQRDVLGRTTFLQAVAKGQLEEVKRLLSFYSAEFLLTQKDKEGNTVLFLLVKTKQAAIMGYLVSHYPQQILQQEKDKTGEDILLYAAENEQIEIIDILLLVYSQQALKILLWAATNDKIEIMDHLLESYPNHIYTILLWAARNEKIAIIDHLLLHYPEKDLLKRKDDQGRTVLFNAVVSLKMNVVEHLLSKYLEHISVEEKDNEGYTPFFWAVSNGQIVIVDHFLSQYRWKFSLKEKDKVGRTALLCAAAHGQIAIVDYLLSHYPEEISLTEEEFPRRTALSCAIPNGQIGMVDHLLSRYPEQISLRKEDYFGRKALLWAAISGQTEMVIHLLLKYQGQVSLTEKDYQGGTILLLAAFSGQISLVSYLLSQHSDKVSLAEKDNDGLTALLYAVYNDKTEMVDYLLSQYSGQVSLTEKDNEGRGALLLAACKGKIRMLEHLLSKYPGQVSLIDKNNFGENVLLCAASHGQIEMVNHLLSRYPRQVSLTQKNNDGCTALLVAASYGEKRMVDHLLLHYLDKVSLADEDDKKRNILIMAIINEKMDMKEHLFHKYPREWPMLVKDAFFSAIYNGYVEIVDGLLEDYPKQVSLSEKCDDETLLPPLFLAICNGQIVMVDHLLSRYPLQVSLSEKDITGGTSLHWAASCGQIKMLDYLLSHYSEQVSLKDKTSEGSTAFLLAVFKGQLEMVKHLLSHYPNDVSLSEKGVFGVTPLLLAAAYGKVNIVDYLLLHYPDQVSSAEKDERGRTALLLTATSGQKKMLDYLLSQYSDQFSLAERDDRGWTALLCAAGNGQIEMVEHLLWKYPKQVSLAERGKDGRTALLYAASCGQIAMVYHLLSRYSEKISLDERENDGRTALLCAVANGQIAMVDHLLSRYSEKISLDERENDGRTALLCAVANGQIAMVDHLLSRYSEKIFLDERENDGRTALLCAVANGKIAMVDYLLSRYSERVSLAEKDGDGRMALLCAVANGQMAMVDHLLLRYPEQVSLAEKDGDGQTALLCAISNSQIAMVDHLLSNYKDQVSLVEKDHKGRTALIHAIRKGKKEMCTHLLAKYPDECAVLLELVFFSFISEGEIEMVDHLLLDYPQHVSLSENFYRGQTPLLLAVSKGQIAMVDHLLTYYPERVSLSKADNDGQTALFLAISNGQIAMVEHLLACYAEIVPLKKEIDDEELSLSSYAVECGQIKILDNLLSHYPDQFSLTEINETILLYAVLRNRIDVIDHLLLHYSEQIYLSEKDNDGETVLLCAVRWMRIQIIDHLLLSYPERFSLAEKDRKGRTLLMYAVMYNGISILKHLGSRYPGKIPLLDRDNEGKTALMYVYDMYDYNKEDMINYLLLLYKEKHPVEKILEEIKKALLYAVYREELMMVDYLLENYFAKVLPDEKEDIEKIILLCAIFNCNINVVGYFLLNYFGKEYQERVSILPMIFKDKMYLVDNLFSYFFNPNIFKEKGSNGQTLLFYIVSFDLIEILDYLLLHYPEYVSLVEKDNGGHTALLLAVAMGRIEMLDHLISNYSDQVSLESKNNFGETALLLAASHGQIMMLDHLLTIYPEQVSLAEKNDYGCTALLLAAFHGRIEMLDHLISHYPNQVSLADKSNIGETALLLAASQGRIAMLDHLLSRYPEQISLAEKDDYGCTVLLCAVENGQIAMVDHLLLHYPDRVSLAEKDNQGRNALMLAIEHGQQRMRMHLLAKYPEQCIISEPSEQPPRLSSSPFAFNARPSSPQLRPEQLSGVDASMDSSGLEDVRTEAPPSP